MILKSYVKKSYKKLLENLYKSCIHCCKCSILTIWHVVLVLGFSFGTFWVFTHSAQWEQALRWLQLQVELQPPTWYCARLV